MFTQVNGVPELEVYSGYAKLFPDQIFLGSRSKVNGVIAFTRALNGEVRFVTNFGAQENLLGAMLQCGACADQSVPSMYLNAILRKVSGKDELEIDPATVPAQWTSWENYSTLVESVRRQYQEKDKDFIAVYNKEYSSVYGNPGITLENGVIPSGETRIEFPDYFFPNFYQLQLMATGSTGIHYIAPNTGINGYDYFDPETKKFKTTDTASVGTLPIAISYWPFTQKKWARKANTVTQYFSAPERNSFSVTDILYSATERKFYIRHAKAVYSGPATQAIYRISEDALTQP